MLAAAHRRFLDLRNAFTRGDQAVIDEVERGEDVIKERFEKAMRDDRVTPQTRDVITHFYESVRQGHDQARAMKHSGVSART